MFFELTSTFELCYSIDHKSHRFKLASSEIIMIDKMYTYIPLKSQYWFFFHLNLLSSCITLLLKHKSLSQMLQEFSCQILELLIRFEITGWCQIYFFSFKSTFELYHFTVEACQILELLIRFEISTLFLKCLDYQGRKYRKRFRQSVLA